MKISDKIIFMERDKIRRQYKATKALLNIDNSSYLEVTPELFLSILKLTKY